MKPTYIILIVVVLLGLGGGLVFFVTKKRKDDKNKALNVPVFERKEQQRPTNPSIKTPQKPSVTQIPESTKFDIKVSNLDIRNNSFDYAMHYGGIPYKGAFKGGITRGVHIKKTFGAFVVKPRMQQELGLNDPIKTKAKQQKMRGVTTKGGAVKAGSTGGHPAVQANRWIDLFILDTNNKILKQLSVNIDTGATTPNAKIPKD